jgi:hypothetical protein
MPKNRATRKGVWDRKLKLAAPGGSWLCISHALPAFSGCAHRADSHSHGSWKLKLHKVQADHTSAAGMQTKASHSFRGNHGAR